MLYGLDRFHCTMLYGYSQRLNCILSLYSLSKLLEYDIEERGKLAWEQDKSAISTLILHHQNFIILHSQIQLFLYKKNKNVD
jgi:hypothetical protein